MSRLRVFLFLLIPALLLACSAGQRSSGPGAEVPAAVGLDVNPGRLRLAVGTTSPLSVVGRLPNGSLLAPPVPLSFRSSDPDVATVAADGTVTAVAPGQATVTVDLSTELQATVPVTVTSATLQRLEVLPQANRVPVGRQRTFQAMGLFDDGTLQDMTSAADWTAAGSGQFLQMAGATGTSVAHGDTTVTAKVGSVEASAVVLTTTPTAQAVRISGLDGPLAVGGTPPLTAVVAFDDSTTFDVTATADWSSDTPSVLRVDGDGRLAALSPGTATITATDGASGLSGQLAVTVTGATLTRLDPVPSDCKVGVDSQQRMRATATFSDGTTRDVSGEVTWISADPASAASTSQDPVRGLTWTGPAEGAPVLTCLHPGYGAAASTTLTLETLDAIQTIVVLFMENRSFDHLYGHFPGVDGLQSPGAAVPQTDLDGNVYPTLPQPLKGTQPDPRFPANLPNAPFYIDPYVPPTQAPPNDTGVPLHDFYQNQFQINGGRMDRFVAWGAAATHGGAPLADGLVMGYHNEAGNLDLPLAPWALQYTLCDRFFQSAFGGSMLNHQWLFSAATPAFRARFQDPKPQSHDVAVLDPATGILTGHYTANVTPEGYAVNSVPSAQLNPDTPPVDPNPPGPPPAGYVGPQVHFHVGDTLGQAGVDWAWYTMDWTDTISGNPPAAFQYHHLAPSFFENLAPGSAASNAHMKDFTELEQALANGDPLPPVVFIKFMPPYNEHAGESAVTPSEQKAAEVLEALTRHPGWGSMVVVVTYDENGGWFDHVPPPVVDEFGPGSRIPALVISPFAKRGYVDHQGYETVSVLKLIEARHGVSPLTTRDRDATVLLDCLDLP